MKSKLEQLTEAICDVMPELGCGCGKGNRTLTRDIQLADVIVALGKVHGEYTIGITSWGNEVVHITVENDIVLLWEPKPLHLQSEETIDFLHSIICNK
jgi:hypothetical protein